MTGSTEPSNTKESKNNNNNNIKNGTRRRSILDNAAYSIFTSNGKKENDYSSISSNLNRRFNHSFREKRSTKLDNQTAPGSNDFLQRSVSADNVVIRSRGFKPSDRYDPVKRSFLENLTSKILHFDMDSNHSSPINLQKLLTPASDSSENLTSVKNKKMYASSYFYAPSHPTVEDQVALARRISSSLSDVKNVKSKGQSMYVNRKKRSVKWVHDGNGVEEEEESSTSIHKEKIPLKCMMNPNGKVLDIHGIQALGEEPSIPTTPPPDKGFDIVRDLHTQKGRGAEIFAKRRKRSEKWIVDTEPPQTPTFCGCGNVTPTPTYQTKQEIIITNENSNFDKKPFSIPTPNLTKVNMATDYMVPPTHGKKLYESVYNGPKISSYQNLANYNTAPRGWDQAQKFYKPVKFEKPADNKIAYSDF